MKSLRLQGRVIATGLGPRARGGDVMYHGRQFGNDEEPISGDIDLAGDERDGDYAGE